MSTGGYIYVLINPSMEGLTKIGKTMRNPQHRVRELSNVTGVPTPFILAYDAYFADCSEAEEYIHTLLERRGYRVTSNREFFNAPLNEVMKIILQAQQVLGGSAFPLAEDEHFEDEDDDYFLDSLQIKDREPWVDVFEEAESYYYGLEETLQDYIEAMRLYKQAAKLGAVDAYIRIGGMYLEGLGCSQDNKKALGYFKEGVKRGDIRCYAEMGKLFTHLGHLENARKSWKKYFESDDFLKDFNGCGWYGYIYFSEIRRLGLLLENIDALRKAKGEIFKNIEEMIEIAKESKNDERIWYFIELKAEIENALR